MEKNNIWKRIINFIKKIFNKNDVLLIDYSKQYEINNKNNMIEEFSQEKRILELQRKYKTGMIKETEISESDKEQLMNLYRKQIENLNINIAIKEKEIQGYKEKILEARQKLLLKNNI